MTTSTDENVFVENGELVIKPTLTDERFIGSNYTIDLRGHSCTGSDWTDCVATTNTTNGTIVNPVRSGRINSKRGASIKYGRIEVVAISSLTVNKRNATQRTISKSQNDKQSIESAGTGITGSKSLGLRIDT